MTKYVLNSGGSRNHPDLAKKFFAEVVKNLGKEVHLLICYFAQPREDWEKKFAEDRNTLPDLFPKGVRPIFMMAFPATLEEQVRSSDAIYIRGGDDYLIQYWLKKFNIPKIWERKVVATSSAGSNALSKYFWTCDWRQIMDGLGILPMKFLAHYESSYGSDDARGPVDWRRGYEELKEYGDTTLRVHALKEGEFVVIEQ